MPGEPWFAVIQLQSLPQLQKNGEPHKHIQWSFLVGHLSTFHAPGRAQDHNHPPVSSTETLRETHTDSQTQTCRYTIQTHTTQAHTFTHLLPPGSGAETRGTGRLQRPQSQGQPRYPLLGTTGSESGCVLVCAVRYSPVFIQRTQTEKQVLWTEGTEGIGVRDRGKDRVMGQSPLPWLPSPGTCPLHASLLPQSLSTPRSTRVPSAVPASPSPGRTVPGLFGGLGQQRARDSSGSPSWDE